LQAAAELTILLQSRRKERGSLDFELPESAYSFDEAGRIVSITRRERLFSHRIIEECMIAANEAVARFLEERSVPVLYRVHPLPEPERLTALFRSLRMVEWTRPVPLRPTAGDLPAFLQAACGAPQEFLVGRLCLRAMMQARYQPDNEGHFGLASRTYCHFTSPIRRYADIVVHRALKYALGLFSGPLFSGGKLLALADQLNRRERAALEAEREMARRLAVLLLADRVGEHFAGVISSVNDFGFFVELAEMPVEGLVRLIDLTDDFYAYDPDRQRLLGHSTGKQFKLGQPLRVALADVHKGRLEIHLIPTKQFSS
jgi:ribonuclease R